MFVLGSKRTRDSLKQFQDTNLQQPQVMDLEQPQNSSQVQVKQLILIRSKWFRILIMHSSKGYKNELIYSPSCYFKPVLIYSVEHKIRHFCRKLFNTENCITSTLRLNGTIVFFQYAMTDFSTPCKRFQPHQINGTYALLELPESTTYNNIWHF